MTLLRITVPGHPDQPQLFLKTPYGAKQFPLDTFLRNDPVFEFQYAPERRMPDVLETFEGKRYACETARIVVKVSRRVLDDLELHRGNLNQLRIKGVGETITRRSADYIKKLLDESAALGDPPKLVKLFYVHAMSEENFKILGEVYGW